MNIRPELKSYIAWIIKKNFVGQLVNAMIGRGSRNAFFSLFYSREGAAKWLLAQYQRDLAKSKPGK